MKTISDDIYKKFSHYLEKECGIVLGENKQYLVKSRLSPLLIQFGYECLVDVIKNAMSGRDRNLKTAVVDAMTTNETLWFRDGYPFSLLSDKLLPELAVNKRTIKIWSAASSSGQEPYSISMIVQELLTKKPGLLPFGVQIIGTDISATMLEHCQLGEYDALALGRGLSEARKKQFFEPCGENRFKINDQVKKNVSFRSLNLLGSYASLGKFDIIFCRNVLIYFSADVKAKILSQFAGALNSGGYLVLGASESLTGLTDKFEMVRCNPGIVYRLK